MDNPPQKKKKIPTKISLVLKLKHKQNQYQTHNNQREYRKSKHKKTHEYS